MTETPQPQIPPESEPVPEESKTPIKTPNFEEISNTLYKELQEHKFFSDQVKVNATLFQGMNLILDKLVKMEGKTDEQAK